MANTGVSSTCQTFSLTVKNCATGYYSFGHEIAHNFGALHNREAHSDPAGSHYGFLIQVQSGQSNMRSVL